MRTVNDIQFDLDYSHAASRFLFLTNQQHAGPSPVVELPNARLLTFIQVFRGLTECQQHIRSNDRQMITLITSDQEIVDWNNQINVVDHNIEKLYIFCHTYATYIQMKGWNGCYRNRLKEVYQSDEVDYQLITLGIQHVRDVIREYKEDRGLRRKFSEDGKRLAQALENYFQDNIDELDNI